MAPNDNARLPVSATAEKYDTATTRTSDGFAGLGMASDIAVVVPGFDTIRLRPLDLDRDLDTLHRWFNTEYGRFWQMRDMSPERIAEVYRAKMIPGAKEVLIGYREQTREPIFLFEHFIPSKFAISNHLETHPTDRGGHLFMAPPTQKVSHLTWYVFRATLLHVFSDPTVTRQIWASDVNNTAMVQRLLQLGYRGLDYVHLDSHTIRLYAISRANFEALLAREPGASDANRRESSIQRLKRKQAYQTGRVIRKLRRLSAAAGFTPSASADTRALY